MSLVFTPNAETLAFMVNRLAEIKAQCADLKHEEEEIKAGLIATGHPVIESNAYRASIALCDGRITVDWKTIAERLNPSHQLISAHTTQGEAYAVVRVSARKG